MIDELESKVDGWAEAEAALAAAQQMPEGTERIDALKKAGLLRLKADERRTAIRNARQNSDQTVISEAQRHLYGSLRDDRA